VPYEPADLYKKETFKEVPFLQVDALYSFSHVFEVCWIYTVGFKLDLIFSTDYYDIFPFVRFNFLFFKKICKRKKIYIY